MRGVVFRGERKLDILDFADPTLGPGEAVIRLRASGMCGSDLHFYRHDSLQIIRSVGSRIWPRVASTKPSQSSVGMSPVARSLP
ncbi:MULTISPECIES: alcohol dehydrogenase catalytic domain-containing protein [Pseudomonas]|uniref:alcohol dehydrogenase catalytic domain-containing protein n=1 Tax=Pseudomonas TaxID=286 RepID=UPI001AE3A450|nr:MULTISPECIES: alcohol dehydrogenase catalytic domain-containing protein [Pseudomonas]MBP2271409.1 NADPH:quinone reductase-like Zn-dependent oxidoreductase [Pseudomonas sp. BP6]MBP2289620.1 NADPH:quinone reductase-like Zn-dependent oxidoreductase [Pseudomonas sp. BP7]HDS1697826.1 hypothetical protein [Pseudomonas putida]HDS1703049.1 hypothetical protein [Pseudomonas putida]